jgi:GT2 family glycosyltransferase
LLIEEYEKFDDMGIISPRIIHRSTKRMQGPYGDKKLLHYLVEAIFPIIIPFRIRMEQRRISKITDTIPVYRTMGSFMVIKTRLFIHIGLFDENTFLGSEEDILAYKLKAIGKYYYYCPKCSVLHESGKSSIQLPSNQVKHYYIDSMIYFWKKYRNNGTIAIFLLKRCIQLRNFYLKISKCYFEWKQHEYFYKFFKL